jgi:hypothetical protein
VSREDAGRVGRTYKEDDGDVAEFVELE